MTEHALLFTDLVDSTRFVASLGDERAGLFWLAHDRGARDLLAMYRGHEIDRSDGFFLLFDEATAAAAFALAYLDMLASLGVQARVGLHVGEVARRESLPGDIALGAKPVEVDGLAKPFAARLMALSSGGQVLLSGAARERLAEKLPNGSALQSHGLYRLKGIDSPVEVFEIGVRGRSSFAPPSDVEKAYRVVSIGGLCLPVRDIRHNLPSERDTFVGRTAELSALARCLEAGARLITLAGPGGTGKTRLACRYAWTWLGDWPGGVVFCDLSEARSNDGLLFAVARALDVPLARDDPAGQLGHAISARGRCLVILDNFEQVVGYADASVGRWLDIVRDAMFVVTSREVLRLSGETVLQVEPLAIAGDAVELFALRARSRVAGFALTPAGRTQVVEIARLLDGLPLAIELAAARIGYLDLEQLLARMQDRFSALASSRSGGTRKSTLRGAIDWSWNLLLPCEQAALAACSVFEGGFSLEAAESVFDLRAWPDAPSALNIVQALLDKSLLRALPSASTPGVDSEKPNFGMYLSIREYAAEKLQIGGAPESILAFERHGAFYAARGSEAALALLFGEKAIAQRALLIADMDNLIVACRRAIAHDRGDVAAACLRAAWEVIELRGPYSLATSLATGVLALGGLEPEARVGALVVQGYAEQRVGRPERAHAALDEALALCRASGERRMRGFVLSATGATHRENGHVQEARTCLEEAITLSRQFGLRRAEAVALGNLANLHYQHSQFDQANALYDEALALARAAHDRRFEGQILCGIAVLERHRGLLDEAEARNHQSLAALRHAGDRRFESAVLNNLAALYGDRGHNDSAMACYGQALVIARELGHRRTEGIVLGNLGSIHDNAGRPVEARAHYEAALVIHREVGDQTFEGIVLLNLGVLDLDEGRFDEARASIEQALALFREQEHVVWQGIAVGELGRLALMQGEWHVATERVSQSELLLRGVGNPLALGKVLCVRGQLAVTQREIETARAACTEAAQIAATLRVGRDSDLGRAVDALSTLLPPECPVVVETRGREEAGAMPSRNS